MTRRFRARTLVPLLALGLVAGACTNNDDDGDSAETSAPSTSDGGAATTPTATVPADASFTVGVVVPPAGLTSELFTAQRRGIEFAQQDVAAGGLVLGGPLGVIEAQVPQGGTSPQLLDDLVDEGANALIAPVSSDAAGQAVAELTRLGSLACSASATSPTATAGQGESLVFFRTVVPDQYLVGELAERVIARRDEEAPGEAIRVTIVARSDAYGTNVGSGLSSLLEAAGLQPTIVGYNPRTVIFDDTAAQVAATDPALTVLVTYEEGPRLLGSLVAAGLRADAMVGLDAFFVPRLAEVVGGDPASLEGFTIFGTTGDRAFLDRLVSDNPRGQVVYAAQAYDCAMVLALAAEEVESARAATLAEAVRSVTAGGRTCTTYADCAEKLRAGEDIDYDGPSGKLAIDAQGDPTFVRFTVGRLQGGTLAEVSATDVDLAEKARLSEVVAAASFTSQLQLALRALGFYDGPIDGVFSPELTAAVAAFQESVGLEPTGVYDEATDAALRARVGGIAGALGTSTADLQRALTELGYYEGEIDGVWSSELTEAIRALQRDLGVPETGIMDVATIRAIYEQGVTTGASTTTTTVAPTTTAAATTTAPPQTTAADTTVAPTAPPTTTAPPAEGPSILEILQDDPDFSTLVTALEVAGIGNDISPLSFTVFAPTNAAFEKLPPADLEALLQDPVALSAVLSYHVVLDPLGTVYRSADLEDGQELPTVYGARLPVTGAGDDLRVGGAAIVKPDLEASNGVVHGIDTVLLPPEI